MLKLYCGVVFCNTGPVVCSTAMVVIFFHAYKFFYHLTTGVKKGELVPFLQCYSITCQDSHSASSWHTMVTEAYCSLRLNCGGSRSRLEPQRYKEWFSITQPFQSLVKSQYTTHAHMGWYFDRKVTSFATLAWWPVLCWRLKLEISASLLSIKHHGNCDHSVFK